MQKQFMQKRMPDAKYVLATLDESQNAIKCGVEEPLETFFSKLKALSAETVGDLGASLSAIFEYIHLIRVNKNLDNIGSGWFRSELLT